MHHVATALCACIMATVVVGGTALAPTPAEAAKTPSAEAVALKEATTACRAEAKEKKINSWMASRKFVSSCLANALKDYQLNIDQLRRELVVAGFRWFTPEETGCLQTVYCEEPSEPYIP